MDQKHFLLELIRAFVLLCTNFCPNLLQFRPFRLELPPFLG